MPTVRAANQLEVTKDEVYRVVLDILNSMSDDWEYSHQISLETYLLKDLGFESIDLVILGSTIEKHYHKPLPFAQFFVEVGQREIRDIRVDEMVNLVVRNLNNPE